MVTGAMSRHTLSALSICVLGAFVGQSAQATISANLSFSDLRFTLVDLTPDDGIGPSATFGQAGTTISYFSNVDAFGDGDSSVIQGLPLPTLSLSGSHNTAAISGTGGALSSVLLSSADINPNFRPDTAYGTAESLAVVGYEPMADTPGMDGYQFRITLGANTAISFDASYATSLHLSQQQLVDVRDTMLAGVDPAQVQSILFSAEASAMLAGAFYNGSLDDPSPVSFVGEDYFYVDQSYFCDTCDLPDLVSQKTGTVSGTYANLTGGTHEVTFVLLGRALATQTAIALLLPPVDPEIPEVPAIPEPGTYALMGLGLVGLLAAARKHQPRTGA